MFKKVSEDRIQADYFVWLWNTYPQFRGAVYHIPNGGSRGGVKSEDFHNLSQNCHSVAQVIGKIKEIIATNAAREGNKLRTMGVREGIPDIHIAIGNKDYIGLYLEFKEPGANMNTEHVKKQLATHEVLRSFGNRVEICTSVDQAKLITLEHLKDYI
jgi:hypothetical protein